MAEFDGSAIWSEALESARKDIPEQEYLMWFRLSYQSLSGGTLAVKAPNSFLRDQFNRKYHAFMQNIVRELTALEIKLEVTAARAAELASRAPEPAPFREEGTPAPVQIQDGLPQPEPHVQKTSIYVDVPGSRQKAAPPRPCRPASAMGAKRSPLDRGICSGASPRRSFFIHSAAWARGSAMFHFTMSRVTKEMNRYYRPCSVRYLSTCVFRIHAIGERIDINEHRHQAFLKYLVRIRVGKK